MKKMQTFTLLLLFALNSCSNFKSGVESLSVPSDGSLDGSLSTSNTTHQMVQVTVGTSTTGTAGLNLSLAVAAGAPTLQNYCAIGGTKPCACELKWVQTTTVGSTTTTVTRTKRLSATTVQTAIVDCAMETSFWDEIATGTIITTKIVPLSGNETGFNVRAIGYKKGSSVSATGDFLDSSLTPFRNIVRYACYSKRKVWDKLRNDTVSTINGTDSTNSPFSTSFCLDGVSGIGGQCPGGSTIYSAQSYYRNLYIQSDRVGQINSKNSAFECPMVEESLKYSSPASAVPTAERGKPYPLDSQFSLAQLKGGDWTVPVSSSSVLYKASSSNSDPDSSDAPCADDPSVEADNAIASSVPIARKCLGYAKKPLPSGACGSFTDSSGVIRPMTRLRRFRTLYPQFFKPNGNVESGNAFAKRWMDEVLIADRLEVNTQGQLTGNAIFGPKPCPFAWFDHSGTTTGAASDLGTDSFLTDYPIRSAGGPRYGIPSYRATSAYQRDSFKVNPDGYHFPNYDLFNLATTAGTPGRPHSCSATLSVVERVDGAPVSVRLVTSLYSRGDVWDFNGSTTSIPLSDVQIRPIEPFMPQYFEDTTFQACVPASSEYLDPPLYLYRNGATQYAWCSKPYPTANPYWRSLNAKKRVLGTQANTLSADALVGWSSGAASVDYFTSTNNDVAGNLLFGLNTCAKTTGICSLLPVAGDQTICATYIGDGTPGPRCDRTVRLDGQTDYRTFPLQAKDTEIKTALDTDMDLGKKTYGCTYSVHPNRNYLGTRSPTTGCCGVRNGSPVVSGLAADGDGGHLEPMNPGNLSYPNRRYCGDPIQ